MGVERSVLVLEKAVLDFRKKRVLNGSYFLARQDQNVVIDVFVFSIASEQNDHPYVFDVLADQPHQLPQVLSLVLG